MMRKALGALLGIICIGFVGCGGTPDEELLSMTSGLIDDAGHLQITDQVSGNYTFNGCILDPYAQTREACWSSPVSFSLKSPRLNIAQKSEPATATFQVYSQHTNRWYTLTDSVTAQWYSLHWSTTAWPGFNSSWSIIAWDSADPEGNGWNFVCSMSYWVIVSNPANDFTCQVYERGTNLVTTNNYNGNTLHR